jgi:ribosomal protein L11 methyltransferase
MTKTRVISLITIYEHHAFFEAFFEGIATTISSFEAQISEKIDPEPGDEWIIEAFFNNNVDFEKIKSELEEYAAINNLEIHSIKLALIENIDFASKVLEDFKPIEIGKFYIYNIAHKDGIPNHLIPMEISAGLAFGTGDHETTSGCIELMSSLGDRPTNILDMGTGSGVLSIAASKLFSSRIVAVDIEENSVITAKQNCAINNVTSDIQIFQTDGYEEVVYNNGPYDLILSNILARPLIEMAEDLARNLNQGGYAILAGFLNDQADAVINEHKKFGLELIESLVKNNWIIAKLRK